MNTRRTLLAFAALVTVAGPCADPPRASAGTTVASGPDLGFERPQVSEDGLVGAFVRTGPCPAPCPPGAGTAQTEVVIVDLHDCGQDVLQEVSRNAISRDPSVVAAGGKQVVFRTFDSTSATCRHGIYRVAVGGGDPELLSCDNTPSIGYLDVSGTGTYAVYWRDTGTQEEIVRLDISVTPPTLAVVDAATDLIVSDEHPIADDGTVFYSKLIAGSRHVFRCGPGSPCAPVQLTPGGSATEETSVSVNRAGTRYVYTRKVFASGVTTLHSGGDVFEQLTYSQNPGEVIRDIGISRDGSQATFASNGDHSGQNFDGSVEIFRVPTAGGAAL
jgi:hypothetical protein